MQKKRCLVLLRPLVPRVSVVVCKQLKVGVLEQNEMWTCGFTSTWQVTSGDMRRRMRGGPVQDLSRVGEVDPTFLISYHFPESSRQPVANSIFNLHEDLVRSTYLTLPIRCRLSVVVVCGAEPHNIADFQRCKLYETRPSLEVVEQGRCSKYKVVFFSRENRSR